MEEKLLEAKKLLEANGYIVKHWTPQMEKDSKECEEMSSSGKDKDCLGCSCSVCLIQ